MEFDGCGTLFISFFFVIVVYFFKTVRLLEKFIPYLYSIIEIFKLNEFFIFFFVSTKYIMSKPHIYVDW